MVAPRQNIRQKRIWTPLSIYGIEQSPEPSTPRRSQPFSGTTSGTVSERMRRQKTTGTECELRIRRELHARGVRYRVDFRPLPNSRTRVDFGWRGLKLAVFIDGCFWHRCPQHFTEPKSNTAWWLDKLEANTIRDAQIDELLAKAGWTVLRFWEHDPADQVADAILRERNRLQLHASPTSHRNGLLYPTPYRLG